MLGLTKLAKPAAVPNAPLGPLDLIPAIAAICRLVKHNVTLVRSLAGHAPDPFRILKSSRARRV